MAAESPPVKARVLVYPRREVLDPQARAIHQALERLGFDDVVEVHAGKAFEIAIADGGAGGADRFRAMCDKLLANPIMERYSVELISGSAGRSAAKAASRPAAGRAAAPVAKGAPPAAAPAKPTAQAAGKAGGAPASAGKAATVQPAPRPAPARPAAKPSRPAAKPAKPAAKSSAK